MDKIAAYNQGVIEGLSTLDLPQNIKLAAARYLLEKVALKGENKDDPGLTAESLGLPMGFGPALTAPQVRRAAEIASAEERMEAAEANRGARLIDLDQRDRDFENNIRAMEQLDEYELKQELANSLQNDKNIYGAPVSMAEASGSAAVIKALQDLKSKSEPEQSPSYLQTALRLARENPEMAAAAGLGTAGLGYGAYRALS